MAAQAHNPERRRSLTQRFQAVMRKSLWGSDIHPTAWIASSALIDRTWPKGIHIARDVVIEEEAVILTHDLTRGLYRDTHVGGRSIIGHRAIILPGVKVGADCRIAAGTLVNRDVPDGHAAAGNPMTMQPIAAVS